MNVLGFFVGIIYIRISFTNYIEKQEDDAMEKQVVTITVITEGEECEMTDQAIIDWYKKHVSEIFNPQY